MCKKQIIITIFFLITSFFVSTIPVEANFSDDQFKSISTVLINNKLDFLNNGQTVPPAVIQCTNGISNQSPRVNSIQQANQVCRDIRNRDQLLFNCIRVDTTYSCSNKVSASQVNQQPSGNVRQEQDQILETSLNFSPNQFKFQGRTFTGDCSISNTMGNLAVCKRTDAGSQRYYGCVDSGDSQAVVRFNCSVDRGIINGDVNSLKDINISQDELKTLQNEAFDPDKIGSVNSTTSTGASTSTSGAPVSYESYTNFPGVGRISNLCQLITALWLLGFAVLLTSVLGMFLWGGYIYVTAGVNAGKVNQAKEIFTNTITGLIIGLSIFIIINIINPGLLQGNCSIPSIGSTGTGAGATIGGQAGPSNIIPKPGESVFPVTREYQCPGPRTSFGYARGRLHAGVDLTPPLSTISDSQALQLPILAFRDGTVNEVGGGFGVVGIDHGGGLETRYLHNSKILVSNGQKVTAGQEIAKMGDAGSPGVIHAHFEVYQNNRPVDPAPIIFDSGKNPDPSKVKTTGSPKCVGQNS
jgi:hypothetical protein